MATPSGAASSRERLLESQKARTRTRPNIERRFDDEVTVQRDIAGMARLEDLDEDTKVIPGRQQLGRVLLAVDPFRNDATPGGEADEGIADHRTTDGEPLDVLHGSAPHRSGALHGHDGMPSTMSATHMAALPSLRVAVLGTSDQGDVRVMPLVPGIAAPGGAATAILVPLSPEDADAIARLFDAPRPR